MTAQEPEKRPPPVGSGGFTLLEVLIVLTLFGIVAALGAQGWRQFNTSATVDRAARSIAGDVALTRSFAVQRRSTIALAADEAARTYAIRDEGMSPPDTLLVRHYSADTDLPLTVLDVKTAGDSFAFNSRGLLVGGGTVDIDVSRLDTDKQITVNAMGRTRITSP